MNKKMFTEQEAEAILAKQFNRPVREVRKSNLELGAAFKSLENTSYLVNGHDLARYIGATKVDIGVFCNIYSRDHLLTPGQCAEFIFDQAMKGNHRASDIARQMMTRVITPEFQD